MSQAIKQAPSRQNINIFNVDILFKIIKPDICSLWLPLNWIVSDSILNVLRLLDTNYDVKKTFSRIPEEQKPSIEAAIAVADVKKTIVQFPWRQNRSLVFNFI